MSVSDSNIFRSYFWKKIFSRYEIAKRELEEDIERVDRRDSNFDLED